MLDVCFLDARVLLNNIINMTPLEVFAGTFSVINGMIALGQFVLKLSDVDSDTKTCILLLERVNKDIAAAKELRKLIYPRFTRHSRQLSRAIDAIEDTKSAAYELGKLVRVSKKTRLTLGNRFRWVMSDKESFMNREKMLQYCHRALVQVIATMESLFDEELQTSIPPPYAAVASTAIRTEWLTRCQRMGFCEKST